MKSCMFLYSLKNCEGLFLSFFVIYSFIKSRSHMSEFLTNFLQFQHFQQFIAGRIDRLASNKERDLFDDEVIAFSDGKLFRN